jgi:hypothetical protein
MGGAGLWKYILTNVNRVLYLHRQITISNRGNVMEKQKLEMCKFSNILCPYNKKCIRYIIFHENFTKDAEDTVSDLMDDYKLLNGARVGGANSFLFIQTLVCRKAR